MNRRQDKNTHYKGQALHYINEAKMLRYDAAVHVEANPDKVFWKNILEHSLPQKQFHFITYSKTKDNKNATGCEICLKYKKLGCLSDKFFICIDSDYRHLLGEKNLDPKNYVFQTYTYSIENHWCYPQNINRAFEKWGLRNTIFDFAQFLDDYSNALYELFLYHLYSLSMNDKFFSKEKFKQFLNIQKPGCDSSKMLNELKEKINPEVTRTKAHYSTVSIDYLKEKYYELGLNNENAFLYYRGHNIFEQVVLKIAFEVKEKLQKEQQSNQLSNENKKAYYEAIRKEDFIKSFSEDLCFDKYDEIKKINKDIHKLFSK